MKRYPESPIEEECSAVAPLLARCWAGQVTDRLGEVPDAICCIVPTGCA